MIEDKKKDWNRSKINKLSYERKGLRLNKNNNG